MNKDPFAFLSESSTTFPSETKSLPMTPAKRHAFLSTLKEEILRIEQLPLENSAFFIEKKNYNKMVDHLEEEKKLKMAEALALSPKNKNQNLMLKPQVFFDGTEQLISVIYIRTFIEKYKEHLKL